MSKPLPKTGLMRPLTDALELPTTTKMDRAVFVSPPHPQVPSFLPAPRGDSVSGCVPDVQSCLLGHLPSWTLHSAVARACTTSLFFLSSTPTSILHPYPIPHPGSSALQELSSEGVNKSSVYSQNGEINTQLLQAS